MGEGAMRNDNDSRQRSRAEVRASSKSTRESVFSRLFGSGSKSQTKKSSTKRRSRHQRGFEWELHTAQASDDKTVAQKFRALFFLVENHINNFYCSRCRVPTHDAKIDFQRLHAHLGDNVDYCFQSQVYQEFLMRNCLTRFLLQSVLVEWPFEDKIIEDDYILLPQELTALPKAVFASGVNVGDIKCFGEAFSSLRVLGSYLRPGIAEDPKYLAQRDAAIDKGMALITSAFSTWEKPFTDADKNLRDSNLRSIFKQVADIGLIMYRQPTYVEILWRGEEQRNPHQIVVSPGINRITDEHAQWLQEAIVLVSRKHEPLYVGNDGTTQRSPTPASLAQSRQVGPTRVADASEDSELINQKLVDRTGIGTIEATSETTVRRSSRTSREPSLASSVSSVDRP